MTMNGNDARILGQALRSIRESTSLSPDVLAQRLQLELATLLGYETGELELPARLLMAYLEAIDRTLIDLHLILNPEPESPRIQALIRELQNLQPLVRRSAPP